MTTARQTATANLRRGKQGSTATSFAGDVIDVTRKLMILDPQVLIEDRIVTEICDLLEADHAVLLLCDDTGDLSVQAEHLKETGYRREMAVSQTVLKLVLDTGESFYSPDPEALKDERLVNGDSIVALDLQSVAATPLIGSSSTIIGVLYLATYGQQSKRLAAEENLPLLQAVANVAATALENAWLYSHDQQLISHRKKIEDRIGTPAVTKEELLEHGLGGYLMYLRNRAGYSLREVDVMTGNKITKSWLSRAERGDIGELSGQQHRLILLAELYNAPPEQLLLMAGLDASIEIPASFRWAEEILQHPELISLLHRISSYDPPHRDQLILLLNYNCRWFEKNFPEDKAQ